MPTYRTPDPVPAPGNSQAGATTPATNRVGRPLPDLDIVSHSLDQTRRIGARLAAVLGPGDLLLLEGPFGAGKTSFTQGLARGLDVGSDYITSPTFTLINEYEGRLPLYHVDLYRLADEEQALDLGLEDYILGDGVTVIEWPQRAPHLLPAEHLTINMAHLSDTKRSIRLHAEGERYRDVIEQFKNASFSNGSGE